MEFIYLGRDNGPQRTTALGYKFEKGCTTEVDDPHAIRKLQQHPHFAKAKTQDDRADLLARAKKLNLIVDKRWGVDRLRQEVKAAEAKEE